MDTIGTLNPTEDTRAGRMLNAGTLTATVRSKKSGKHVTLRLRASAKNDGPGKNWPTVPFEQATHVFIDDYDGERIATYYPQSGKVFMQAGVTQEASWTVAALLRYLAGAFPTLTSMADVDEADFCGRCGRELTDPVSIERGIGPECFGILTGSKAQKVFG